MEGQVLFCGAHGMGPLLRRLVGDLVCMYVHIFDGSVDMATPSPPPPPPTQQSPDSHSWKHRRQISEKQMECRR
jgi:hypothetical protein